MTFTTRPTLAGTLGMVSSTHWLASQAGMAMLEHGGNAADGAVAAGLVLQVVEPHLNGPGGDLPLIVASVDDPTPRVLCGQGPAPAGATPEHFLAAGLDRVPGSGPLATAVPGAFEAWMVLLRDKGTMTASQVAAPALGYALNGHPILERVCTTIGTVQELFTSHWTTSAAQWLVDGAPPAPGSLVTNRAWARTLQRLLDAESAEGTREQGIDAVRRAWSQGFVAEAIGAFAQRPSHHSGGRVLPGVITAADLADFEATWEDAALIQWQGHTIAKTGPWGQGPALLQVLALLDAAGESDLDTVEGIHTLVEAWKLAMADREAWLGDGSTVAVEELLDAAYVQQRASLIGQRASRELRPGSPGGREPRVAAMALLVDGALEEDAAAGEPTVPRVPEVVARATSPDPADPEVDRDGVTRGDTCHVDVVDRWGMLVSATPSGGWLQSSPTIPELGFCLGSRLQMAWLEQGLASSLVPGQRPRTTLTPTLVLRDGIPILACGSPGGDQQDQWQSVFLLRLLVSGMSLQEAIDAPTFHTTSFPASFHPRATEPGVLVHESRLAPHLLEGLRARGHELLDQGPWSLGRMCVVGRDPETGILSAAANPRGMQGYAVGR